MSPAFPLLSKIISPVSCPSTRENNGEGEFGRGRDEEEMVVVFVIFSRVSAKILGVTSFLLQEIRGSLLWKTCMFSSYNISILNCLFLPDLLRKTKDGVKSFLPVCLLDPVTLPPIDTR